MTRIVRFHETGAPDVLRLQKVEPPTPGPNEVQIDVKAIGLNLDQIAEAHRYMEANEQIGKIVVKV